MRKTIYTLGFWSAILSAVCSVLWFISFSMKDMSEYVPPWQDVDAYAETFSIMRHFYIYPSLVLAVSFLVLVACIHHYYANGDKKIWSLIGLAMGVVYSTMASINYNIQAVSIRQSLANGATAGISFFLPDNPFSAFTALANSYVYMALAMVFLGFVFDGGGIKRIIRLSFFAQAITVIGQIGWSMFDLSMGFFIATSLVWVIGAPVAFILLAILFRREYQKAPGYVAESLEA